MTQPAARPARSPLRPADWIAAGLRALLAEGPAGLRVEALARDIGATKGSFYWHFRDGAALRQALLDHLSVLSGLSLPATDPADPPRKRLVAAIEPRDAAGAGLRAALRAWATTDPAARAVEARLDAADAAQMSALMAETGMAPEAAERGARIVLALRDGLDLHEADAREAARRDLRILLRIVLNGRFAP